MPLTLQKIEPISKKARIVASLREAIISGGIRSGEQIVEGKLAQQLGVGQGVLREALIELEHHGFVQRVPYAGTQVTELTILDAQQIYDIRIELEPLAFFLAGESANAQTISELRELADKASIASRAGDLTAFFENHLAFRTRIWTLSGNRYLQQALERIVIPLYALYMIRQSFNLDGILQTTIACTDHQDRILAAYERKNFVEARETARNFLIKMKEYLGTRLPPASSA
ncbi:MAG: GntR family transcriptional regulator [Acidobacteria bacterium]|nr:GntR family transcriptional regulator [Acidobacteriota bacterium]